MAPRMLLASGLSDSFRWQKHKSAFGFERKARILIGTGDWDQTPAPEFLRGGEPLKRAKLLHMRRGIKQTTAILLGVSGPFGIPFLNSTRVRPFRISRESVCSRM